MSNKEFSKDIKITMIIEKNNHLHMGLIRDSYPENIDVGWIPFQFTPFFQDTDEIIINRGTIEEEYFEPTLKWVAKLKCMNTKGSFFSINVTFKNEEVINGMIDLKILQERLVEALETMEDYRLCGCHLDKICDLHR